MENGRPDIARRLGQLVVRVPLRSGQDLLRRIAAERRRGDDSPGQPDRFDRDPPVARVDADGDPAGKGAASVMHEIGIAHRHRAKDHTLYTRLEPRLDGGHVPDAAAELNRKIDGVENCADRVGIDRLAGKRAVEIDDMEPGEARGSEGPRLRRRVVGEDRRPRHVSLDEAHAGAALEIDRGKEDHGAAPGGRSVRSLQ